MSDKCGAIGALIVGGRVVGQVKCDLETGHDVEAIVRLGAHIPGGYRPPGEWASTTTRTYPPSAHAMTMTWNPEESVDMDLFDPAEHFDVDVPVDDPIPYAGPGPRYAADTNALDAPIPVNLCGVLGCVKLPGHTDPHSWAKAAWSRRARRD